ncbi:hypothetical protein PanWU01x14_276390 [Parasponia andersonii]|uniref:Uncharacterized protein n=1 Tax=Parasponia andersonii TaxID=3476 RepID=A0A2P5B324_PARAD|nr:hypothetical protein PanWU01x14_276390 [Parasponia andersonii]
MTHPVFASGTVIKPTYLAISILLPRKRPSFRTVETSSLNKFFLILYSRRSAVRLSCLSTFSARC